MSSTASRPLRADARRNRKRVLEAAHVCFARDGIDAQMDDIAACAGVGVGTVYRHFATKEALIEALAADYFEGQSALARDALGVADPWEAFSGFVRRGAALMADSRALPQVMADRPEMMRSAAIAADAEFGFFGIVETLIARAKQVGTLRQDFEIEDIPAIMCSLGSLQLSKGSYVNWRRLLEIVLDGVRAPGSDQLPPVSERLPRAASRQP
jgi:AcrR family transcriptional regulator